MKAIVGLFILLAGLGVIVALYAVIGLLVVPIVRKAKESWTKEDGRVGLPAVLLVLVVLVVILLAASCAKSTESFRDAPRGATNDSAADILNFPDGFSNVAAKCDGTARIYVAFKADANRAAITAVPNHPKCGGTR